MDFIFSVLQGAFVPEVIIFAMLGVFLGVTVGAIPGLSGDMAIALLLPFVYKLNPVPALGMLIGIYKGSMFGGAISAISFGVPGTPAAVVTMEDGYPAKKKGYPKKAMLTALYSSVTGDFFSTLILIFLALPLASVSLKFGPVEFFALYVFAMMMIALLVQGGMKKGLVAAGIGLFVGCIGMDPVIGTTRLIFGISRLRGGIPLIPLLVGVFAVSELMIQFAKEWYRSRLKKIKELSGLSKESGYNPSKDIMSFKVYLSTLKATMIGSAMGTFIGALPGAGSSLAAYVSYGAAKRASSHPEQFGKGILEGVAAPEAGNSATCGASMIPLLTFGIPGSAT
ncbi:MAG: tripartite tricarboxylate transporter permease, partial [Desulfobacteraceae bacterium]|nr:tripartite tricarboxylate transporter permease [Desulfobacteraceae bacterium]